MPLSAPPAERRRPAPEEIAPRRRWIVGFVLSAAAGVALCAAVVTGEPLPDSRWTILVQLALWSLVWALTVLCVFRLPARTAVPAAALVAVVLRLVALSGPPTLSDDLYRSAWDGRVQAAGVDPDRHPPASPALEELREPWLWPDEAGCADIDRPAGCTRINRPTVRTIYPPLAERWFAVVYRVGGVDDRHKPWQVAGLVVDLAVIVLLLRTLRAWGRDPRWIALYGLSPFPVVELVNNGHVDGLAALLVVAAALAAARRSVLLGAALLGAAALVKLYPLLFVAALAGVDRRRPLRALAWGSATALAVVAAGYVPHVHAVGARVLGYLPGYLREEQYGSGERFLVAGALGLPAPMTAVLAAAGLVAAVAWVLVRRPEMPHATVLVLGALLLTVTPVQPWYAVPLLALAAVAASPAWALTGAAAYPYFFAVILDAPQAVVIGRLGYVAALVLAAAALARRRPRQREPAIAPSAASTSSRTSASASAKTSSRV